MGRRAIANSEARLTNRHMLRLALRALVAITWAAALFATAHAQTFVPFQPAWGKFVEAADHSHLNKPLTPADAIAVSGPHFVKLGPDLKVGTHDDERVRLFGINLSHEAAFPSPERAKEVAVTLRSLGFNAVRLHHMDTQPTGDARQFRSTLTTAPYPSLHAGAIERLKRFILELRQQGIYVNLNLMVGYSFRPTVDGVPALDDKGTAPAYGSPVHVFFPKMVDLQVLHAQRLIGALQLKNDPALAQVEIMNESSLASAWLHWQPQHWATHIRGPYAAELDRQWNSWVDKRHGSMQAACQAWTTCDHENGKLLTPADAEALQHGVQSGFLLKLKQKGSDWLQSAKAWVTSSATARPLAGAPHPKVLDTLRFIAETDRGFLERMRRVVQEVTRPTLPVAGTQVNFGAPLNFESHRNMDYVDAHFYVDHPDYPGGMWSDTDWRIRNESMADKGLEQLLALALYRDKQRPFVVSEFNQPFPNQSGQDVFPVTAAVAAMQDWDGLYFFDYVDAQADRVLPNYFNLQGDWPKTVTVGLAARMFRTLSIAASASVTHPPSTDADWLHAAALERRPDTWERFLGRYHRMADQATLTGRLGNTQTADWADVRPHTTHQVQQRKDDRQIRITAPTVHGLFGEMGPAGALRTDVLAFSPPIGAQPTDMVSLLLHSLDGAPLTQSRHMLLVAPTQVMGSQPGHTPPQVQQLVPYKGDRSWWTLDPGSGSASSPRRATAPLWLARKVIPVRIRTAARSLTVYPLGPTGTRMDALPPQHVVPTADGHELTLNAQKGQAALWFEITSP